MRSSLLFQSTLITFLKYSSFSLEPLLALLLTWCGLEFGHFPKLPRRSRSPIEWTRLLGAPQLGGRVGKSERSPRRDASHGSIEKSHLHDMHKEKPSLLIISLPNEVLPSSASFAFKSMRARERFPASKTSLPPGARAMQEARKELWSAQMAGPVQARSGIAFFVSFGDVPSLFRREKAQLIHVTQVVAIRKGPPSLTPRHWT